MIDRRDLGAAAILAAVAAAVLCAAPSATAHLPPATYNTAGGPVAGKLNVHIIPHTHDGESAVLVAQVSPLVSQ